ncbi:uncharacterized protein TrAFT101_009088 [Trichoderma asperellum]|uniref:uncharacterized protein n=1 Tax=Trichoderma asperellum TaxID=101201 RepID=UPI00332DA8F7|nr:hypothetical protein TrAFT101_009088 [Trichoderma asperellum]
MGALIKAHPAKKEPCLSGQPLVGYSCAYRFCLKPVVDHPNHNMQLRCWRRSPNICVIGILDPSLSKLGSFVPLQPT